MYRRFQNRRTVRAEFAPDTESGSSQVEKPHGITRGARYYGGKQS